MAGLRLGVFGSRTNGDARSGELASPSHVGVLAGARSSIQPMRQHTEIPPTSAGRDGEVGSAYERKHSDQALAQEQAVFERNLQKDNAMFRLQMTMGWATVVIIPASVAAIFLDPGAAVGLVPINGLAAWNWRRTLTRNNSELEATTKPPGTLP